MATQPTQSKSPQSPKNPWEMKVGSGSSDGYEYVLCPPDNYPGTIVGIYDIGHQHVKLKDGTEQDVRKIVVVFELSEKRPTDGKPFILLERYTWSMRDNSNFYALVKNVTGSTFRDGETFNPLSLMGTHVMVGVTNTQAGERTYHNVGSVGRFPKSFPAPPEPVTKLIAWSVLSGEPFPREAESLPFVYGKSIYTLATESSEWKSRVAPSAPINEAEIPF